MKKYLIIGVLAAACNANQQQPAAPVVAGDSADMIFDMMKTNVTRSGVLVASVSADSAWYYQSTMVSDLKGLRVVFTDSLGRVQSTITSKHGNFRTTGDQVLDARDSVVAVTPRGDTLRTSHLLWDKASNRIESDTAFTFKSPSTTQPGTFTRMSGQSFVSTPDFKRVSVVTPKGREVTGGRAPAKTAQKKPPAAKKDSGK